MTDRADALRCEAASADVFSRDGKTYMRRKSRFRLIRGLLLLVIGVYLINIE